MKAFLFIREYPCFRLFWMVLAVCYFHSIPLGAQVIQSVERASLSPGDNQQGDSFSYDPHLDGSGRFVAFTSTADNFAAPGKVEGQLHEHAYLRDTLTGVTTQLDLTNSGRTGSPSNFFNPTIRVFRSSFHPHPSRDGSHIVFTSPASDISPDGAGEAFGNWAYLKNIITGSIQRIPYATAGDPTKSEYPTYVTISGDGAKVVVIAIVADINDTTCSTCFWELTLYDRASNTTTLINTGVAGNKFNPALSDDGRYLVFENQVGDFSGPTYAYLHDLTLSQTVPLNNGNISLSPAISGDGKFIAYSDASVVPLRIRLRNRETGEETLISSGQNGLEPNGISEFASLSADGRYTAFLSTASNLVAEDENDTDDIFVYDRITQSTTLVSVQGACKGVATNEEFNTGPPSISSDGKTIAFAVLERLAAADRKRSDGAIEKADTNSFDDVYVATIDYDAQPSVFTKGLRPNTPFVSVSCKGNQARLQLEDILTGKPKSNNSPLGTKATQIKKVTQEIVISKIGGVDRQSERQRLVAKRNTVTTRSLSPGTYTAQVQARALQNNGTKVTSKLSKPARFVITK